MNSDLDMIDRISGWVWAVITATSVGIVWIVRKVYVASKFILQVETHTEAIKTICVDVEDLRKTVETNKTNTDRKLDQMLDFIRDSENRRAEYAEKRELNEVKKSEQERLRHREILDKIEALKEDAWKNETNRKNTHKLLEDVRLDLKETDKKYDEINKVVNKTVSFIDGKLGTSLNTL